MNEKKYDSPTTPGLKIDLRNYLIELVCLNVDKRLGPRFWQDSKYWGPKYRREIKGVFNLFSLIDIQDPIVQTATIHIVTKHNIKALVAKKTLERVVKLINKKIQQIKEERQQIAEKARIAIFNPRDNCHFIDCGDTNKLAKIKRIESGKETKIDQ